LLVRQSSRVWHAIRK